MPSLLVGNLLAGRNRLPPGLALGHIGIIAGGVGAIVPSLPGVGARAVAIVGIVAVVAGARIVAVIPVVGVVAVKAVIVVGKAVTPPIWGIDSYEPAAEMPGTRVGAAAVNPAIAVKSPPIMSGIGRLWVNHSRSTKQHRRGCPEGRSDSLPGTEVITLMHRPILPKRVWTRLPQANRGNRRLSTRLRWISLSYPAADVQCADEPTRH